MPIPLGVVAAPAAGVLVRRAATALLTAAMSQRSKAVVISRNTPLPPVPTKSVKIPKAARTVLASITSGAVGDYLDAKLSSMGAEKPWEGKSLLEILYHNSVNMEAMGRYFHYKGEPVAATDLNGNNSLDVSPAWLEHSLNLSRAQRESDEADFNPEEFHEDIDLGENEEGGLLSAFNFDSTPRYITEEEANG